MNVMKKSIKRRGDHSEYDHPDDISLSLNKPGIARTHKPLNIFEPMRVPETVS